MESRLDSYLWKKLNAYQREAEAIEGKLKKKIPAGKREKLEFRLSDLRTRIIPKVLWEVQA